MENALFICYISIIYLWNKVIRYLEIIKFAYID